MSSPPAVSDPLIGRKLGEYEIRERIGRGGMAVVYRAHQFSVHRDVALKLIPLGDPERADEEFRLRFAKEAELVAGLEHIHILPVYAYGIADDVAYLAMRLLRGGTLAGLLRGARLPVEAAVELFCQFASGLHYAHIKGVVHRDLKPSNIMLDDSGHALLTDFGLAKLVRGDHDLTESGIVVGTPSYMSPEQVQGRPLDARSDIYSASVVLYHMLTGKVPFGGPSQDLVTTIYHQIHTEPERPTRLHPDIPRGVEAVVLRGLRKAREERYPSIDAMATELSQTLGRRGGASASVEELLERSDTQQMSADAARGALQLDSDFRRTTPPQVKTSPVDTPAPRPVPWRRWLRVAGPLLLLAAATFAAFRLRAFPAGEPTRAIVRAGEQAPAAAADPTPAEVARARRRLGDGFIACVTCTQSTEYHATQAREMSDRAASYGLGYRVYDSDGDDYRQLTLIEKARADGARGLIVCPLNAALLAAPLTSASQAGLPLVLLASGMPAYGGVLIAGDDYGLGLQAGRFAGEIVARERGGRANVVIVGYPELPYLVRRADGLEHGLLEKAPDARIVGRVRGGTREFAEASVGELLAGGGSFDVILSINDAGAIGAIAAIERAGIPRDAVVIASVDAEALAREYIVQGRYIRGSVAIDRELFSRAAVGAMTRLLAGATLPETFVVAAGPIVSRATLPAP